MNDFSLAHDEVVRLHDFLGAWFRGELFTEEINQSFACFLHPDFENVQPAGVTLTRGKIVDSIREGRGTNPEFQIIIEAPRLLASWTDLLLFQYIEYQTGARSTAPENRRLSTVLFERDSEKLIWRYLTEIGL